MYYIDVFINFPKQYKDDDNDLQDSSTTAQQKTRNDFVEFVKEASCLVQYEEEEERYIGFAEKVLESNWNEDQLLNAFRTFVDCCIPAVTTSTISKQFQLYRLSKLTTVAEEAFAFLILENNIERWKWLAFKDMQERDKDETDTTAELKKKRYVVDTEVMPPVLYQKRVKISNRSGAVAAGDWTDKGMQRYNQIVKCVLESRKKKERINYEDKLLKLYSNEDDDGLSVLESGEGKRRLKDTTQEDNRKRKKVMVIDLFSVEDLD